VWYDISVDQTTAETIGNYTVSGGINVLAATQTASDIVELTVDALTADTHYNVTINNVETLGGTPIAANSIFSFSHSLPRDPLPNVVVIIADDLGYSDISHNPFHGTEVSTPNIDALINSGIWFSNAYAPGNICAPSRAGYLIGMYQQRVGIHYEIEVNSDGVPTSTPNIAEHLSQAYDVAEDYVSTMIGKWHSGRDQTVEVTVDGNSDGDFVDFGTVSEPLDDYGALVRPSTAVSHPMNRGFDEVYGFLNLGGQSYWEYGYGFYENFERKNAFTDIDGISDGDDVSTYLTTRLTDKACDFIERQVAANKPFHVHLAYNAVHAPMHAPASPVGLNEGDEGWYPDAAWYEANYPNMWQSLGYLSATETDTQAEIDAIVDNRSILMAMLYHMDQGIGRVIQTLVDQGVRDNTIVVFWSDNGGASASSAANEPLRLRKHFNYEGGVRVPMTISWPAELTDYAGTTIDAPVTALDILPTVLDAANIEPVYGFDAFDGKSWLPLIKGEVSNLHDYIAWSEGEPEGEYAIRAGDWKLYVDEDTYELYNLAADIDESDDLSASNPDKLRELRQLLYQWMADVTSDAGETLESRLWSYGTTSAPDGSNPINLQSLQVNNDSFVIEFDEKIGWISPSASFEATDNLNPLNWQTVVPDTLEEIDRFKDTGSYQAVFTIDRDMRIFRITGDVP
jgi:arylsulfatase A-like enzyme